ncbi:MAG: DUF4260 family protein [Paracoccaceae bacterium]
MHPNPTLPLAPAPLLRAEAALGLATAAAAYALTGGSWLLFAALFLTPDLAMLAYLRGPRFGAALYNLAHWAPPAAALAAAGYAWAHPVLLHLGLIWLAHIAFDRALGYGLKLPSGFSDTHLGRIGRRGAA